MTLAKIMLSITALVWIGYGGWLFVNPTGLSYLGYEMSHWSVIVEIQAMYGGFEVMLGVFALLGVLYPKRYMHSALLLWAMLYSSLVVGRIVGILQWGGTFAFSFGPNALPDSYNPGALFCLEIPSALLMIAALRATWRHPELVGETATRATDRSVASGEPA